MSIHQEKLKYVVPLLFYGIILAFLNVLGNSENQIVMSISLHIRLNVVWNYL